MSLKSELEKLIEMEKTRWENDAKTRRSEDEQAARNCAAITPAVNELVQAIGPSVASLEKHEHEYRISIDEKCEGLNLTGEFTIRADHEGFRVSTEDIFSWHSSPEGAMQKLVEHVAKSRGTHEFIKAL